MYYSAYKVPVWYTVQYIIPVGMLRLTLLDNKFSISYSYDIHLEIKKLLMIACFQYVKVYICFKETVHEIIYFENCFLTVGILEKKKKIEML